MEYPRKEDIERIEREEQEENDRFVVDNDMKAEWCLEKITEKRGELKKWKDHYEKLYKDIEDTITRDISNLEEMLKGYFFQKSEEGFTRETATQEIYNLPHGKIFMARQQPDVVRDDGLLIEWLKANAPGFVKTKEEVSWGDFKKTLTVSGAEMINEDGEVIPGIVVNTRPAIFKVEVK